VATINTNVVLTGWVSLEKWCALDHRWRVFISHGSSPRASLETPAGSFLFSAGSTSALWNGTEVRLGFAPRCENDQMLVHALDIEKTVRPLVLAEHLGAVHGPVAVIDPGHGGSDPGAHSPSGRLEKEFTLDWARRLEPMLAIKGWQVFSTRTNDADVPLTARVEFAERHHADLFVSLHFNSSPEGRQQGIETYCFTPCGMKSSMNRGYEDDPSAIYPNNAFDGLNLALGYKVHSAVIHASGSNDRGVRRARFPAVLKNQNRPAILIEGGYISCPTEAERLADPGYRQKLAEAVANAICNYVDLQTTDGLKDVEAGRSFTSDTNPAATTSNAGFFR
jgi:N-acetylmuramoyl-L-alanine amidase